MQESSPLTVFVRLQTLSGKPGDYVQNGYFVPARLSQPKMRTHLLAHFNTDEDGLVGEDMIPVFKTVQGVDYARGYAKRKRRIFLRLGKVKAILKGSSMPSKLPSCLDPSINHNVTRLLRYTKKAVEHIIKNYLVNLTPEEYYAFVHTPDHGMMNHQKKTMISAIMSLLARLKNEYMKVDFMKDPFIYDSVFFIQNPRVFCNNAIKDLQVRAWKGWRPYQEQLKSAGLLGVGAVKDMKDKYWKKECKAWSDHIFGSRAMSRPKMSYRHVNLDFEKMPDVNTRNLTTYQHLKLVDVRPQSKTGLTRIIEHISGRHSVFKTLRHRFKIKSIYDDFGFDVILFHPHKSAAKFTSSFPSSSLKMTKEYIHVSTYDGSRRYTYDRKTKVLVVVGDDQVPMGLGRFVLVHSPKIRVYNFINIP